MPHIAPSFAKLKFEVISRELDDERSSEGIFPGGRALIAGSAWAAEHGVVSSIGHDEVKESLFRVNIEKINGDEPSGGINHHAHVGKNTVTVSLVFNSSWGNTMSETQKYIYKKDIELDVEQGKHYFLAARVDTNAEKSAIDSGSFWEPVIAEVHD